MIPVVLVGALPAGPHATDLAHTNRLDRARAAAARIDKYGNRAAEIIDRIRSFYKKSPPSNRQCAGVLGVLREEATTS